MAKFIEVTLSDNTKYAINVNRIVYFKTVNTGVYVRMTDGSGIIVKTETYESLMDKITQDNE